MKLLQLVKDRISPQIDVQAEELASIREELVNTRTQLRLLNMAYEACDPEYQETMAQELNALKEREHALIKQAKRIQGERINIASSLREYREAQEEVEEDRGTIVPV